MALICISLVLMISPTSSSYLFIIFITCVHLFRCGLQLQWPENVLVLVWFFEQYGYQVYVVEWLGKDRPPSNLNWKVSCAVSPFLCFHLTLLYLALVCLASQLRSIPCGLLVQRLSYSKCCGYLCSRCVRVRAMCLFSTDTGFSSRQLKSLRGPETKAASLVKTEIRIYRTISYTFIYFIFYIKVVLYVGFS